MEYLLCGSILEAYKAQEIAEEDGITEKEAAILWFEETYYDGEANYDELPTYHRFVGQGDNGAIDVYYDYGADYYFAVINDEETAKHFIEDSLTLSDSRKVSDGLEEGASPTFFFDCDLNLDWSANYGGSRYYAPYNDLDYESFHDEKGKELPDVGFYTYEECYDAALKRAMDFYYEGVEMFSDNPDVDVTGVHVQIIKLDENGDFGDYEDFFNIYPTEDNAETGKFIID